MKIHGKFRKGRQVVGGLESRCAWRLHAGDDFERGAGKPCRRRSYDSRADLSKLPKSKVVIEQLEV